MISTGFLDGLRIWIDGLDVIWQWLGILLISAIPYVESYFGSFIGTGLGINVFIAIISAIIGNIISMLVFVFLGEKIGMLRDKSKISEKKRLKRQKLRDRFDKYGIIGVSLMGQIFLPSQITSSVMVGFGLNRNKVIFWQIISIILWGIAFGIIGMFAFSGLHFN